MPPNSIDQNIASQHQRILSSSIRNVTLITSPDRDSPNFMGLALVFHAVKSDVRSSEGGGAFYNLVLPVDERSPRRIVLARQYRIHGRGVRSGPFADRASSSLWEREVFDNVPTLTLPHLGSIESFRRTPTSAIDDLGSRLW